MISHVIPLVGIFLNPLQMAEQVLDALVTLQYSTVYLYSTDLYTLQIVNNRSDVILCNHGNPTKRSEAMLRTY